MRTLAGVSSATRMRAGLLTTEEYTRAENAVRTYRSAGDVPAALPAGYPRARRGAYPHVGPAQAARRLPAGDAALPRHGRVQRPDAPPNVAAHRLARRGPPARRSVPAAAALTRHADASHGNG